MQFMLNIYKGTSAPKSKRKASSIKINEKQLIYNITGTADSMRWLTFSYSENIVSRYSLHNKNTAFSCRLLVSALKAACSLITIPAEFYHPVHTVFSLPFPW